MSITISELRKKLEGFQSKCENLIVRDFKEETPVANTGSLKQSVRVLRRVKNVYSVIGTDLFYAAPVEYGGERGVIIPDYYGNKKSIHNPRGGDFSEPRFRDGARVYAKIGTARPNPYGKRTYESLLKVDWNDVFWDENGEYADFE